MIIAYFFALTVYIWRYILDLKVLHMENWVYILSLCFFSYSIIIDKKRDFPKRVLQFIGIFLVLLFYKNDFSIEFCKILFKELKEIILLTVFLFIYYHSFRTEPKNYKKDLKLFKEREKDLETLETFLKGDSNILGLEDDYGAGKSFLIEKLFEEIDKDKYEIINIRCLLLEKDFVYQYICKKINNILIKNNIFSGHVDRIKEVAVKSIENRYIAGISSLFSKVSNIDEIENFREAIFELDKKLLIVFDDIDRVNDTEIIDKIFSFADDFSKGNIKTILLYNLNNLKEINQKYNRNYIEKYIPLTITPTEISFKLLLEYGIKKYNNLKIEEFKFLEGYFSNTIPYNEISDIRKINERFRKTITYNFNITPRKMDIFLKEVKAYFDRFKDEIESNEIKKRTVISFCFLKHILYEEFYEKIDINSNFEDIYPIELYIEDIDKTISLTDYEIIHSLAYGKFQEEKGLNIIDRENKYIKICNKKIFLNNKDTYSSYLNKIEIDRDFSNITEIQNELKNKLSILKIKLKSESKINFMIYDVLNYPLYTNNLKQDIISEKKDSINKSIKKLRYLGKKEFKSAFKRYYDKLKNILEIIDLEEREKRFINLGEEYYFNGGEFETIFYLGEYPEEKIMIVLDVFNDEKSKERYLELLYFRGKNKIDDKYIRALCKTKINNIQIYDNFIDKIIEKNYKIELMYSLEVINKSLNNIISRVYLFTFEEFGRFDNAKNYEIFSMEIIGIKNNQKELITDDMNEIIEKHIEFLKVLINLEENKNSLKEESCISLDINPYTPLDKYQNMTLEQIKKTLEENFKNGTITLQDIGYSFRLSRNKK